MVKLVEITTAGGMAAAAARTCYSKNGIVSPEVADGDENVAKLLGELFTSGHLTTFMHAHFTLAITDVSRLFIWRVLHSHQYYNSEQVSQRYTRMTPTDCIGITGNVKATELINNAFIAYDKLIDGLTPLFNEIYPKQPSKASKKAQELARYVLPQSTTASLYHTVNVVTLLRYIALGNSKHKTECDIEAKMFSDEIERLLLAIDGRFEDIIAKVKCTHPKLPSLGNAMRNFKEKAINGVYVYNVEDPIVYEADLINNYANTLKPYNIVHDMLKMSGFKAYQELSITSVSQLQRHRGLPGVYPLLSDMYSRDYYIPSLIKKNDALLKLYTGAIEPMYDFINSITASVNIDNANDITPWYYLPNAHKIGVLTSNNYADFAHFAMARLCRNAQEEICNSTNAVIANLQVAGGDKPNLLAVIDDLFREPCMVRKLASIHPTCPEAHTCGASVFAHPEISRAYREY